MKVTIFNSKKTLSKVPQSPRSDNKFIFESRDISAIKEVFNHISSNFTLNIPLIKSVTSFRRKDALVDFFVPKIDYIILDIDHIDTSSDRELTLKYFRDSGYAVILGESRSLYNLKGVLKVEQMTQKQGKAVLKEISQHIPGSMDPSSLNYASYQAPILKNVVLLEQQGKEYPKPDVIDIPQTLVSVPDNIEQLCIDEFARLGFSFDTPTTSGYRCSHPSEIKSKGGFTWDRSRAFNMQHWNQDRNVSVWEYIIKTQEYKDYQKEKSKLEVKDIMPVIKSTIKTRYLDNSPAEVEDFLNNYDILKIQSPMGTAKSAIIEEVIHQSRKKGLRVLFLTNRISLADDIEKKYDNIKHYLGTELEGNQYNFGDDLVVQIDSLHKFSTKYFDVCIMDEAATTMLHLLTLENHQKNITSKIFSLKKKKLVLADAFLFDDMVDVFGGRVLEISNKYRDVLDLEFYQQKDKFIFDLIQEAKKTPVTFSSGSTQVLKIVKLLADQSNLKSITISSETTKEERKLIYHQMTLKKPKYDILMYSPSLTVGVSNENKIDTHYHFDGGLSMNVLSSIQMTKRTREAKRIRFFLAERIKYQTTDILRIQSGLTDFNSQDEDGDSTGISKAGVDLSKIIQLNNTLENRHKVSFLELMKYQFKILGNVKQITEKVQPFMNKFSKIVKQNEKQSLLDLFEEYKVMSPEKLSDIEYKLFATSKKEEAIKLFLFYKSDESLKLSDADLDILIQGEIENPGCILMYKMNIKNSKIMQLAKQNNYSISLQDALKLEKKGIDLKEYGFIKHKTRFLSNKTLKSLIKF